MTDAAAEFSTLRKLEASSPQLLIPSAGVGEVCGCGCVRMEFGVGGGLEYTCSSVVLCLSCTGKCDSRFRSLVLKELCVFLLLFSLSLSFLGLCVTTAMCSKLIFFVADFFFFFGTYCDVKDFCVSRIYFFPRLVCLFGSCHNGSLCLCPGVTEAE